MFSREEMKEIIETIQNLKDIFEIEKDVLQREMDENDDIIEYFDRMGNEDSRDKNIRLDHILQDLYGRLDLFAEEMKDQIIALKDYMKTQKELE